MSLLVLEHLGVTLRDRMVLRDVSLRVGAGEFVGLIGPNGAGKTTLMRAALGLVPYDGASSLAAMGPRARARVAAWMPQSHEVAWPVTVERLVTLGRIPHLGAGGRVGEADRVAVERALVAMELGAMRSRVVTRLSGGEQARVLIARVLAQETPLVMADEPIAGLDPAHQIATMEVFAGLAREGRAVVTSLHDLGLAVRHCTRLVVLGEGGIQADGAPEAVLTADVLARVFGITAWQGQTDHGAIFQPLEVVR